MRERKYTFSGINSETYYLLFGDLYCPFSNPNFHVLNYLDGCTLTGNLKKVASGKHQYCYKNGDISFFFGKVSERIANEAFRKNLTSTARYHCCHELAIDMCRRLEDATILTGYLQGDRCLILHSVIRLSDGEIFDLTRDLAMNEDDYVKLTLFDVKKASKVSHQSLVNDWNGFLDYIYSHDIYLSNSTYLLFRDELVQDYQRIKKRLL